MTSPSRNDPTRVWSTAVGVIAGILAALLLDQLGLGKILGDAPAQLIAIPGAAAGGVLGWFGRVRSLVVADVVIFAFFLLIADTPIMSPPAAAWVRADSLPARADAIAVLSSDVNSAGMLDDRATGRLLTGLELLQRGVAPLLITTEVTTRVGGRTIRSTPDQERLVTLAGVRDAWSYVTDVHSTRDEALRVAERLGAGGTVVVVTSPMHTRRACATFEMLRLRVWCMPSREPEFAAWHPKTSGDRLEAFRQYAYERLGMAEYRVKGWVRR
jgi:uncharacterized SAM-binding protein YcdF (DUF218 family)